MKNENEKPLATFEKEGITHGFFQAPESDYPLIEIIKRLDTMETVSHVFDRERKN
ncbi:hypothetical protein [Ekhidna sp.]|uniref:hypothetical protein n=1 Tax=Ekhidna sp. TaxID=2608089 RepID=UPI003C7A99E0